MRRGQDISSSRICFGFAVRIRTDSGGVVTKNHSGIQYRYLERLVKESGGDKIHRGISETAITLKGAVQSSEVIP